MYATYVVGAVGIVVGMYTVHSDPPSLSIATLLAVGLAGLLSFVRHSVFHRSDAARMGWDLGTRNNFQIEVGLANLAWGATAVLAVLFDWGITAQATTFLVFGIYLLGVAVMQVTATRETGRRPLGPLLGLAAFGIMLSVVGGLGILAPR
jgi:hypothetical protein